MISGLGTAIPLPKPGPCAQQRGQSWSSAARASMGWGGFVGSFFVFKSREQLISQGARRARVLLSQCSGSTCAAAEAAQHTALGQPGVTHWCLLACPRRCSSATHPQPSLRAA